MTREIKISSTQLTLLMIGFLFGDFNIMAASKAAYQDSWIAFIIGWLGGTVLIAIYIKIAILNPSKNLIEILQEIFGKPIGGFLSILYIWYFIHISSLVFRSFMEYMVTVNYPETPILYPLILSMIVIIYITKSGFEVTARLLSFVVSLLLIFTITLGFTLINRYDFMHMLPLLEDGWKPVLTVGYSIMTFPFGETVVFLMIFPLLNNQRKLKKSATLAVGLGGIILLSTVVRDLLVLGPDLLFRTVFPPHIVGSLVPVVALEPVLSTNLLISGGAMVLPLIYGALKGIQELFKLDDYNPIVLVMIALITSLTIWVYDSIPEMFEASKEIYPYYAIPFQIIIPLIILMVSLIKKNRKNKKTEAL